MTTNVRVYLDEDGLEFSDGAIRCGFIVTEDENGDENFHHGLIDNCGYHNLADLIREVAAIFNINSEMILVA